MGRRIFLFHTLTLILALVVLLAASGGVIHLVFWIYQDRSSPADDGRAEQVRDILLQLSGDEDWPELAW